LFEKIIGKDFTIKKINETEWDMAYDYIKNNFFYILDEEDFTIKTILDAAKVLIKTRGIKQLIIDPYNKLDHKYTDSETQYISRFLDQIIKFAKMNDILIFLVAHPRKMNKVKGGVKIEVPSLYDISGSANFYNKTDYGITVHRKVNSDNIMINEVEIYFQKIKYKHLGEQGIAELNYDYVSGRFNKTGRDQSNWLVKCVESDVEEDLRQESLDFAGLREGDLPY
jgi:twinkle protein